MSRCIDQGFPDVNKRLGLLYLVNHPDLQVLIESWIIYRRRSHLGFEWVKQRKLSRVVVLTDVGHDWLSLSVLDWFVVSVLSFYSLKDEREGCVFAGTRRMGFDRLADIDDSSRSGARTHWLSCQQSAGLPESTRIQNRWTSHSARIW